LGGDQTATMTINVNSSETVPGICVALFSSLEPDA
jgi:hypothetical protein